MFGKGMSRITTILLSVVFLIFGFFGQQVGADQHINVFEGKIQAVSKKAKTISINASADGKAALIKYTDKTEGAIYARKGREVVITYVVEGKDLKALSIAPEMGLLPEGVSAIQPDEVAAIIASDPDNKNHVLIDSRPQELYLEGHVPTSVSINIIDLQEKGKDLLPADKSKKLIFYCGGRTCGLAPKSAGFAQEMGYTNVHVMASGIPGWEESGRVLVASHDYIKNSETEFVLIDVRTKEEASTGYIPKAVNIPMADLKELEWQFPSSHWTPVILYGSGDQAIQAFKMLKEWGYKTVLSTVDGGIEGWLASGGKLVTGTPPDKIHWAIKLNINEINIADFKKALAGDMPDTFILDVRNVGETEDGMFPKAYNIPLDELGKRFGELPKDKEILVHCSTGVRADMAVYELKKAGFKARFVVVTVDCVDGECKLME